MQSALFIAGLLWLIAARTASERAGIGLTVRFQLAAAQAVLSEVFFLFLLLVGFTVLHWVATREGNVRELNAIPKRKTSAREWLNGTALGWGMALATILPLGLAGDLYPHFFLNARYWGLASLSLAAAALGTLAIEVAFRGYVYRRLIDATGPVLATILMSVLYALLTSLRPNATSAGVLCAFLLGVLLSQAYLRTHALWLGWGLHFAWNVTIGILFGLPVRGAAEYASLVQTDISGSSWLTGGAFGPDGAFFTAVVLAISFAVLYRQTRDFAWDYTHPTIVPGGYPVTVQPPAAHVAMEEQAQAGPAALVQIATATPSTSSTSPEIASHIRGNGSSNPG